MATPEALTPEEYHALGSRTTSSATCGAPPRGRPPAIGALAWQFAMPRRRVSARLTALAAQGLVTRRRDPRDRRRVVARPTSAGAAVLAGGPALAAALDRLGVAPVGAASGESAP